ncbi:MAG TPA: alkyl sulfatase dimerization domain-containing protein [Rubrivivax sp.]|nr:alkyl sulfatase dimerization domain-containing protein [Rubrivivax sp.]
MRQLRQAAAPLLGAALLAAANGFAQPAAPKPATPATEAANAAMQQAVAAFDKRDFEDATRGKLAELPDPLIKAADGRVVWDARAFDFIMKGPAPATVNPSLWRLGQLNHAQGLFKVADGIYQIRGYDIAGMTLVEGATGWIVIDTTLTAAVARASLKLAMDTLKSTKPVVAVIYTHSHVDHFGGVRGVVDEADVRSGKVKIIAPDEFMQHAIAENVRAGNALTRRAQYMYGAALTPGDKGNVGIGLGPALSADNPGLIPPTQYIKKTGEELTIDGVRIQFQMAQGSEAPSEFMFYFPDKKALCLSEVATKLMHNVYTIRGAKVRDALGWSKYINQTMDLFPDAEVAFSSHHWPTWGKDNIRAFLANQRDTYRFLHDRALHLANQGLVMDEIGSENFFPKGLAVDAASRGYYGSLSHNLRAVYNFYLGYYDANPATLNRLPPADSAKRYVAAMGGEAALLASARKAFADGDYRWVAELVNHAVFANPGSTEARALQADALEQLGYQTENATWRGAYLMGAQELRAGFKPVPISTSNPDTVRGMTNELLFDFMALRLDHTKTDGSRAAIQLEFTDVNETWALELSNSVLNSTQGRVLKNPDLKLTLTRPAFLAMLMQGKKLPELVQAGMAQVEGNPQALGALVANTATFTPDFNIVTP